MLTISSCFYQFDGFKTRDGIHWVCLNAGGASNQPSNAQPMRFKCRLDCEHGKLVTLPQVSGQHQAIHFFGLVASPLFGLSCNLSAWGPAGSFTRFQVSVDFCHISGARESGQRTASQFFSLDSVALPGCRHCLWVVGCSGGNGSWLTSGCALATAIWPNVCDRQRDLVNTAWNHKADRWFAMI